MDPQRANSVNQSETTVMQISSTDFVTPPAAGGGHRSVFENLPEFEPQKGASLDGVLFSGKSSAQTHADLEAVALAPLVQLVRAATSWPEDRSEIECRVADFRFLVLDFRIGTDQVLYVQIRSTPTSHLIVEVGPGTPKNMELQALMTRQTASRPAARRKGSTRRRSWSTDKCVLESNYPPPP